jgi:hypothetical protein
MLRFTDPRICSSIITACGLLHNFILMTSEEEQLEMNQEMANFQEERDSDEENDPMIEIEENPRERRRRGNELLNQTVELFKRMHGIQ